MEVTDKKKRYKRLFSLPALGVTFLIMICFWLIFSGKYDRFHLILGFVSSLIVAVPGSRLLFPSGVSLRMFKVWVKFIRYLPWLFLQIFFANIHVLYLSFHPKMMDMINPKIIRFNTRLKTDVSRTTFANSITLTPGTITVFAGIMGSFAVHCIDDKSGKELPGKMEENIEKVFDEQ